LRYSARCLTAASRLGSSLSSDSGELMIRFFLATLLLVIAALAVSLGSQFTPPSTWHLTAEAQSLVPDARLRNQIFQALSAAENAGTDPSISHFKVRAATVIDKDGKENVVLGGNTEYNVPEAIHGETSLINHVTALYGSEATRTALKFVAFYSQRCGPGGSCGDCRDYQKALTDAEHLLIVCGQPTDHSVSIHRFREQLVDESQFPSASPASLGIAQEELEELVNAAEEARSGGVTLFTVAQQTAAAALSYQGKVYRAAAADDAAFHYRYPVGGVLQQAATERDYLLRAIVVVGEKGSWPVVRYRDRQYGYEASSFNHETGRPPIALILADGLGNYRATTFEAALPNAFSTANFMPEAMKEFLRTHLPAKTK
jgi:cytidine deaminase